MTEPLQRRKVVIVLTAAEWRSLKIAAAIHDTTIQGYMSDAVLARLQSEPPLDAAAAAGPQKRRTAS